VETEVGAMIEGEKEVKQIGAAVCLCFFFSGATGLIYEVLWTRMLGLVFGHTVFAITTVLAAFMAGLGLGSYLFGGVADRYAHPLRLYGLLEAGIGIYVLLTPALFSQAEGIYIGLHRSLGLSFFAFSLAQFALIFLILLVPTTLMGATLPVLSRFFVREITALGGQIGRLYALNTFGAVLGTYAAGFHLIPILGVRKTLLLGAVANIGIGILATIFDRHLRQLELEPAPHSPSPFPRLTDSVTSLPPDERPGRLGVWLAVLGLGLSGVASMMYEVAWTRALALVIGSSTYAFSTMLVTFLAGLALGSYLFSRLAGRLRVSPFFFGGLQLGIGLSALAVTPFFDRMPEVFLWAFRLSQSPGFVKVLQFIISALAMFVPTLFMGATFPCVAQIASRGLSRVGHDVGRIYFVNTMGAIAGTVLAGFLLIPAFGLQPCLKLAVSLNLGLALVLFLVPQGALWRKGAAVVPLLALAVLYVSPSWDANAMASGVAIYGRSYFSYMGKAGFREAVSSMHRLLLYRDGISATVSVHREGETLYLRVNGKTDASNATPDMHTQLMLGHLPLLFRPEGKRVLVIGLGSGVTGGAVTLHPVQQVDIIEIEPAVVEGAAFFARENREVLKNPRVRLAVADGRNFLLASEARYDVIISEPSNPWMRGIGNLFSLEFYELVARRLAPKGIVCQWIHVYNLFPEDLKMVVNTFRSVFPHTTIWNTTPSDLLLIGSKDPLSLDYASLRSRYESLPALREDLARLGFHSPLAVLADFALGEADAARYTQSGWLNTDDLPLLEFSAPESLYVDTLESNQRLIRGYRQQSLPPIAGMPESVTRSAAFHRDLGLAFWGKETPTEALTQFDEALRLDPRDARSFFYRGRVHLRFGSVLKAEADFKAALRVDPKMVEAHEALGQLYKAQKMWEPAEAQMRQALTLQPKDPRHLAALADLSLERKRPGEAIPRYLAAAALAPQDASAWTGLGLAYQGTGQHGEAVEAFKQALARNPSNSFIQYQLGLSLLELKRMDEAHAALQTAAAMNPMQADPHLALGRLYTRRGELERAREAYRQALRLDPLNTSALRAVEELPAAP